MGLSDLENSLQDAVLDKLGEDIQRNLDFGIECSLLQELGWTVLEVVYSHDQPRVTVMEWADQTFKDGYKEHNGIWLIENAKDATMFALKWKTK